MKNFKVGMSRIGDMVWNKYRCTGSHGLEMNENLYGLSKSCSKMSEYKQCGVMQILNKLMCINHVDVHKSEVDSHPCITVWGIDFDLFPNVTMNKS